MMRRLRQFVSVVAFSALVACSADPTEPPIEPTVPTVTFHGRVVNPDGRLVPYVMVRLFGDGGLDGAVNYHYANPYHISITKVHCDAAQPLTLWASSSSNDYMNQLASHADLGCEPDVQRIDLVLDPLPG